MNELHICLANHHPGWRSTLVDHVDWIRAGFAEIGFNVTVSEDEFRTDIPNVIFENKNSSLKPFLDTHGRNIPLICYVTELIKGETFETGDGAKRYGEFLSIAPHYRGFLTSFAANLAALRQIAPTSLFEFGYSQTLVSTEAPEAWEYDYSFCGSMTPYRRRFIAKVSGTIDVFLPGDDTTKHTAHVISPSDYVRTMSKTAINICLRQSTTWRAPSPTKLPRIVHCGTGAAVEATEIRTPLSKVFPTFSSVEDFLARFSVVDRALIAKEAAGRLAWLQKTLPLSREIRRNIDECPALANGGQLSGRSDHP
jgi:hypothetical protein